MKLLNAEDLANSIKKDIEKCQSIYFAVAWVTSNDIFKELAKAIDKVAIGVIGLNLHHTDPAILTKYAKSENIFFRYDTNSVFHPKIYIFQYKTYCNVYIGSSNLTTGGFGSNEELNIKLKMTLDAKELKQFIKQIEEYTESTLDEISKDFIEDYTRKYNIRKITEKRLKSITTAQMDATLAETNNSVSDGGIDWSSFIELAKEETLQGKEFGECLEERKALLEYAKDLFAKYKHLKDMSLAEQRVIAGVCNENNPENPYYAWFGNLHGFGYMQGNFNINKDQHNNAVIISDALDLIPLDGEVTFDMFEAYIQKFNQISNSDNPNMKASYYRFLAMKRPDLFFPLNKANSEKLIALYDIKGGINSYKKYWEVLQKVRKSKWYTLGDTASEEWNFRMALLDSICYKFTNNEEF
ncbi:hypothetical protein A9Z61_00135 [Moraxella osloensis]|nr:phospholipase D-like domain-containing protein [Moraxella osloensis]OBX57839.1 hypothetical protein A9Z61_00135 [Moraxella osloensis]BAV11151.1 hypothetical protein MOSL_0578 [Moraxella osloensis]